MNLTTTQQTAIESLPAKATVVADLLGYQSTSGVYDLFKRAEERDSNLTLYSDHNGVWHARQPTLATDGGTATAPRRTKTGDKAARTKSINDWLTEVEKELSRRLDSYDPATADYERVPGNLDMVVFRTDDHFGEAQTEERYGLFDSNEAASRVWTHVNETLAWKDEYETLGYDFDGVTLLMNGDHVTGEDIFPGQAHHIDHDLRGQMDLASSTYVDVIRVLADNFPTVRVICQHGNHGELRTGNQSGHQNADDLLYDRLDLAVRMSALDNVEFVTNHVETFTEFDLRTHRAQMRHGQDGLGHIGTNSAKKRWLAWLQDSADYNDDTGFDVGYWGHYHELKVEPIAGRPVLMGGTLAPSGAFVDSLGIAPGRPGGWSHTVSDTEVVEQLKPIYFN